MKANLFIVQDQEGQSLFVATNKEAAMSEARSLSEGGRESAVLSYRLEGAPRTCLVAAMASVGNRITGAEWVASKKDIESPEVWEVACKLTEVSTYRNGRKAKNEDDRGD